MFNEGVPYPQGSDGFSDQDRDSTLSLYADILMDMKDGLFIFPENDQFRSIFPGKDIPAMEDRQHCLTTCRKVFYNVLHETGGYPPLFTAVATLVDVALLCDDPVLSDVIMAAIMTIFGQCYEDGIEAIVRDHPETIWRPDHE